MYNDFVEDEYVICPLCTPEYVHCDEKCEECYHYIEFKNYFKEKEKNGRS